MKFGDLFEQRTNTRPPVKGSCTCADAQEQYVDGTCSRCGNMVDPYPSHSWSYLDECARAGSEWYRQFFRRLGIRFIERRWRRPDRRVTQHEKLLADPRYLCFFDEEGEDE